jgi:anti-anti-sigma regulatory factor
MDLNDSPDPAMPAWALGPSLTLVNAEANRSLLVDALPLLQNDPRLDLSGVHQIDTGGVQLLLSLRSTLAESGQSLALASPSREVTAALELLGLRGHFPAAPAGPAR